MEQMTNFKLEIEPSETLHTKFGTAKIDKTTGISLTKLEEKVKEKGLKWTVLKE